MRSALYSPVTARLGRHLRAAKVFIRVQFVPAEHNSRTLGEAVEQAASEPHLSRKFFIREAYGARTRAGRI